MNHWMWVASLAGILSTAVVWGTDVFFLTVGRSALRLATISRQPKSWVSFTCSPTRECRSGAPRQSCRTFFLCYLAGQDSAGFTAYRS